MCSGSSQSKLNLAEVKPLDHMWFRCRGLSSNSFDPLICFYCAELHTNIDKTLEYQNLTFTENLPSLAKLNSHSLSAFQSSLMKCSRVHVLEKNINMSFITHCVIYLFIYFQYVRCIKRVILLVIVLSIEINQIQILTICC